MFSSMLSHTQQGLTSVHRFSWLSLLPEGKQSTLYFGSFGLEGDSWLRICLEPAFSRTVSFKTLFKKKSGE